MSKFWTLNVYNWVVQLHLRFRCRLCIRLDPPGPGFLRFAILSSCVYTPLLLLNPQSIVFFFDVVETPIAPSDMIIEGLIIPVHLSLLEFYFQEKRITNRISPIGLDTWSRNTALRRVSIRPKKKKTIIIRSHPCWFTTMREVEIPSQVFAVRLSPSSSHP